MAAVVYEVGDIVTLKKGHPCGIVYRSAAREWLCVGELGLRGVLWEGICDGGSRDGGRIKSYNKIKQ